MADHAHKLPDEGRGAAALDPKAPSLWQVSQERLLQDWKDAHDRADEYLIEMGVGDVARADFAMRAVARALQTEHWLAGEDAVAATMRALRELLIQERPPPPHEGIDAFAAWRLHAALADQPGAPDASVPPWLDGKFRTAPPLSRRSMVPYRIERRPLRRVLQRWFGRRKAEPGAPLFGWKLRLERSRLPWVWRARWRRLLLGLLVLIPSVVASGFMANVLPHQGRTWIEVVIVLFFGALFGWISIGFWTAVLGFFILLRGRDRFAITRLDPRDAEPFAPQGRTAIVMPICEEPVERVFAGLRAIYQSLERTGGLAHFDFFVLSDSADPGTTVKEEAAWFSWCRDVKGFGHIFYRRRKVQLKRKNGNVADFCRRWGQRYTYMIMLDADSIMSGDTLVRLVRMIERNADVGMIQTAPVAVNRRSLLARVQQFSGRVYGPMFTAGLHFWQLGDGQYWGHNTIIRIKPFMDHCGLPKLPGNPPLGGPILSHDFVEAALMGRAGWSLWLAYDLDGSYEEVPSTLLEEMKRDRRWCQGNLQHLRLLFTEGLFGAHRALFINGVLSYVSALLWFAFLILSTVEAIYNVLVQPDYFPNGPSLFPEWPVWRPEWAMWLLGVTGLFLFLPKFLSVALIAFRRRNARAFGGIFRLLASVLIEIVMSSFFAPVRMVFHSRFVVTNLFGRQVIWRSQERDDSETGWREAIRHHWFDTLFASAWGIGLYTLNPGYFWWVTPIIGALIVSIPLSVFTSRVSLGDRTRRWRLFMIPEEIAPPIELRDLYANLATAHAATAALPAAERDGFVLAAADPIVNAVHRGLLGAPRSLRARIRAYRQSLVVRAVAEGPESLNASERKTVLRDPSSIGALHESIWALPDRQRSGPWGPPGVVPGGDGRG